MAKGTNQKLKLLYLGRILSENTDENNPMTIGEMIDKLGEYGISAERKSMYSSLEALREFGLDIVLSKGRTWGYYVASGVFELPELKLLVDAVQSSKFITQKKSEELIKKLEGFSSKQSAKQLHRQVYIINRPKTVNESIYYNVDTIYNAISDGRKISFVYYEWALVWGEEKICRRPKRGGDRYNVSPWALTWDDENYYLVCYDDEACKIRHFRVDKMSNIDLLDQVRDGLEIFRDFDLVGYSKMTFGMFGGKEETVRIQFHSSLIGVVADRFGADIFITPAGADHFNLSIKVAISPIFLSWVIGFGGKAEIIHPEWVREEMKAVAGEVYFKY